MVLDINIIIVHGLSNKTSPQLQPKNPKAIKAVFNVIITAVKVLYELYITNKTEHFSFKSGCVVWVTKCLKEDWFIGLW